MCHLSLPVSCTQHMENPFRLLTSQHVNILNNLHFNCFWLILDWSYFYILSLPSSRSLTIVMIISYYPLLFCHHIFCFSFLHFGSPAQDVRSKRCPFLHCASFHHRGICLRCNSKITVTFPVRSTPAVAVHAAKPSAPCAWQQAWTLAALLLLKSWNSASSVTQTVMFRHMFQCFSSSQLYL